VTPTFPKFAGMLEKINQLLGEVDRFEAGDLNAVEEQRIKWLSKKGEISALFDDFRTLAPDQKREVGQKLNELKTKALEKINTLKDQLASSSGNGEVPDLTLPGSPLISPGSRHPLSIVRNQITDIFSRIGFTISEGREIEDEWHNFSAL